MPGHKYKCDACGATFWMVQKARCLACGGPTSAMPSNVPQKASCAVCGNEFKPRDAREKTCGPECSRTLSLRNAADRARERYAVARERKEKRTGRPSGVKPWGWLERVVDEGDVMEIGTRRTVLGTLADKTEANDWPYPDVLAGAGPCLMDEYPFL